MAESATPTILVYIQTEAEDRVPLGEWSVDDLGEPIRLVKFWGLVDGGGVAVDTDDLFGEFVIGDGSVEFRISAPSVE